MVKSQLFRMLRAFQNGRDRPDWRSTCSQSLGAHPKVICNYESATFSHSCDAIGLCQTPTRLRDLRDKEYDVLRAVHVAMAKA